MAYDEDLAHVHDVGFSSFASRAAPGLIRLLHRGGVARGRVVDLGCGSGIWAERLAAEGYDVLGLDVSPDMVRLARRRAPGARFRTGSWLSAPLPACDAVTAFGEVVNYRFDPRGGRRALGRLFRRVHDALRPGGLFLFDAAGPARERPSVPRIGHWEGPGWALFLRVTQDASCRGLTRRIVTFRRRGAHWRRREELHRLLLYTPSEIAAGLRAAGFRVRILRRWGRLGLPRGVAAFVARKR